LPGAGSRAMQRDHRRGVRQRGTGGWHFHGNPQSVRFAVQWVGM